MYLRRTRVLLALLPASAAWMGGCGGDSPAEPPVSPVVIRAEGYVHSQTDGSPINGATVSLVQIDYVYGTVREVDTTVRTDTEGYYYLEAEYPYECPESGLDPVPVLTAYKRGASYFAEDHIPDCSTELQRLDFELQASYEAFIDDLHFVPDTLRLRVGESAIVTLIVLDTNADTVSSTDYPHFVGNERLEWWPWASDAVSYSRVGWNGIRVTGDAVGTAEIDVYFQHERPGHHERQTAHGVIIVE